MVGFSIWKILLNRVLTDRGTESCGAPERHEYELYLTVENIDHTRTKTRHPQTNGICERFHKTLLNEFSPFGVPEEDLSDARRTPGRFGRVAAGV